MINKMENTIRNNKTKSYKIKINLNNKEVHLNYHSKNTKGTYHKTKKNEYFLYLF